MLFDFSCDRGGTFTDIYCEITDAATGDNRSHVIKLLSVDPLNYADAPTEGIRRALSQFGSHGEIPRNQKIPTDEIRSIRMGTTVATNALLERKGDKVALLISAGLKDTLEIGNMSRPKIFDLEIKAPTPVYAQVVEVTGGRMRPMHKFENADILEIMDESAEVVYGTNDQAYIVEDALNLDEIRQQLKDIKAEGTITSLAIVLMHSYAFPDQEEKLEKIAREVGFEQISLSSKVMPRIKLVERGQTCCVDAYLNPHIFRYLTSFVHGFDDQLYKRVQVFFMQSDGGLAPLERFTGSKAILSGPAGGVVGYASTSEQSQMRSGVKDMRPVIGFDMGGTSTDVSRYHLAYEHIFETEIAGTSISAPQLNISTVAAGGGSRLNFEKGLFKVGPESTSADPGPVCYRKRGGKLAVTDANLILGRLLPEHFPKIFGKTEDEPLDKELAIEEMLELTKQINKENVHQQRTVYEVALGFIKVANEAMSRPIRQLTQNRGFNPKSHILDVFGGAGAQHACAIAKGLGISTVYIHKHCGILSAYGLGLADVVQEKEEPLSESLADGIIASRIQQKFNDMQRLNEQAICAVGFAQNQVKSHHYLNLRYIGTNTSMMIEQPVPCEDKTPEALYSEAFQKQHQLEFGFNFEAREILIDNVRCRSVGKKQTIKPKAIEALKEENEQEEPVPMETTQVYFEVAGLATCLDTNVYDLELLLAKTKIQGPAIILNKTSTILIEPYCNAKIDEFGNIEITLLDNKNGNDYARYQTIEDVPHDPIELSIFGHRFMSIAEQMGTTLQRTSASTNIKERLDFSCALFDLDGSLVANAPHVPVHLGSMQDAVSFQVKNLDEWGEGDVILSNTPTAGGTHLPDMTIITPVFKNGGPIAYLASRGHHSDIGGIQPGSMPAFSKHIDEEGAQFESFKIVKNGVFNEAELIQILTEQDKTVNPLITGTRNLADNIADFKAQIAANNRGIQLLDSLVDEYSLIYVSAYMLFIQSNAEKAVRDMLVQLSLSQGLDPVATIHAEDLMDDGSTIRLALTIDRDQRTAKFDFQGTDPEMYGNCNAPRSITQSAIIYCLRCLVVADIPLNQGCLRPIEINVPLGCFLNPTAKAAVVGGNVLTSQRVTDVILKAFSACAASQGCMNNFTFGDTEFGYYETIGGGAGAGPHWQGKSGIQVHMTNTRITDPEIMESRYPVILRQFTYRQGSGGQGQFSGGDGIVREVEFLKDGIEIGLLTERRTVAPYGLNGGQDGARGKNLLTFPDGRLQSFGAKNTARVLKNTRITILTPGGGGYGQVESQ